MFKKTRKLLFKIVLVGILLWVVSTLVFITQPGENSKDKNSSRKNDRSVHFRLTPLSELSARDNELQKKFADGQTLLKQAQGFNSFKIPDNKLSYIKGYENLDEETKSLIERGLIVPKWDLDMPEVPEFFDAPGELGRAYNINVADLKPAEKLEYDKAWEANAFNGYLSNRISLHRSLQDTRDRLCQQEDYSDTTIDTSVIIIFHNEDWSTLLRTVYSVLDRSPPKLIREIILVDDFSNKDHLGAKLDDHMSQFSKVKILRADKRQGLIRARLIGAAKATGDVLTFLDSHCECTKGWLEPLLKRIQQNESNVATPVIDVIDEVTFRYMFGPPSTTNLGGFDWNLQFSWHAIPPSAAEARKSIIEPLRSPTMAGGLFSISRKYFEKIGSYDPGMEVWGGENLELSFRIWTCGGSLEIIQCSHVGHVFRKRSPYRWTVVDAVRRNSVRTALVWMDKYSKYYFEKTSYHLGNYGDISQRVALRKRLKCKSFQWYLENIYPEQFVPGDCLAIGQIKTKLRNPSTSEGICIESTFTKPTDDVPVKISTCARGKLSQVWYLTKKKEIYVDHDEGACLDNAGFGVKTFPCHGMRGNQEWEYRLDGTIFHVITELCLEISENFKELVIKSCSGSERQVWIWSRNTPISSIEE